MESTTVKPKIVWVSHSPTLPHVGQSRVSREFCNRLYKDYDLTVVGLDHLATDQKLPYKLVPARTDNPNGLIDTLVSLNPDALIFSHDMWRFYFIGYQEGNQPSLKDLLPKTKIIGYFTIDGDPLHDSWFSILRNCELVISPSEYGKRIIQQSFSQVPVVVVPYGVDTLVFKAEDNKDEFKKQVDKDTRELHEKTGVYPIQISDKFVCCYVGMNQSKKNIGAIVDSYARFAVGKSDVFLLLVLHSTGRRHRSYVQTLDFDVHGMLREHNLTDKCFVMEQILGDEGIARIFKMADCLLYPSIGEGFGLQLLEAQRCKCIPIATDYTSLSELLGNYKGLLIKVGAYVRGPWNVRRAVVDSDSLVQQLEYLYILRKHNTSLYKKYQDTGYNFASNLTWDNSYSKLKEVLDRVVNREDVVDLELERL